MLSCNHSEKGRGNATEKRPTHSFELGEISFVNSAIFYMFQKFLSINIVKCLLNLVVTLHTIVAIDLLTTG